LIFGWNDIINIEFTLAFTAWNNTSNLRRQITDIKTVNFTDTAMTRDQATPNMLGAVSERANDTKACDNNAAHLINFHFIKASWQGAYYAACAF
jgi:hypothetical protein